MIKKVNNRPIVVGIGVSAGAMEAISQLLKGIPQDSGMSFVIVQHPDPASRTALVELLQHRTQLPIQEVTEDTEVQPDHVYVIPPRRCLSIQGGVLQLSEPQEHRGSQMTIDYFLSALAKDACELAVGVVLSGTGSDGTDGLRKVKRYGGISVVQDPSEAAYPEMPQSALDAVHIDYVLPAEKIGSQLKRCVDFRRTHGPLSATVNRLLLKQLDRGVFVVNRSNRVLFAEGQADLYVHFEFRKLSPELPDIIEIARKELTVPLRSALRKIWEGQSELRVDTRVQRDGVFLPCQMHLTRISDRPENDPAAMVVFKGIDSTQRNRDGATPRAEDLKTPTYQDNSGDSERSLFRGGGDAKVSLQRPLQRRSIRLERMRSEAQLAEREARLRRMVDHQMGLVGVLDRRGILVEANERHLALAKVKRNEVIGKYFADAPYWAYDDRVVTKIRDAMTRAFAGETVRFDVSLLAHGEGGIMVDFTIAPVQNANGESDYLIASGVDISERYAAEQALLKSESRFRSMVGRLPLLVWVHDAEGYQEYVNRAFCDFFGVEEESMREMKWQNLIHLDDYEAYVGEFRRCLTERCHFHAEVRARRADGTWRWMESWAQARFAESGEYLGHIGASTDITDRREADEELKDSKHRLAMAMETARMGSFWWEPDSNRCDWDDQWYDAMGIPHDAEKTGNTFFALIHPEDQGIVEQATRQALEKGEPYRVEFRTITPDGRLRWIAGNGRLIPAHNDQPRRLVGLNWDITHQKRTEHNIRLNEQRLLAAAEAAGFGMIHADLVDGRFACSEQMMRLVGRDPKDLDSKATSFPLDWVHSEDRDRVRQHFDALERLDEFQSSSINHRIIRPDGEIRWVQLMGKAIYEGRGKNRRVTQVLGTVVDITDRRRYEKVLQEARDIAESANRSKSEFVANLSHEIRTPMTAILGYTEILQEYIKVEEGRRHLATIRRNGNYLLEIINDILDISKIEAGKLEVHVERFEPARVVEDVRNIMEVRATESNLRLTVEYATPIPKFIQSDAKRLKQILINLVGNAIKFTRKGSVRIRVNYQSDHDSNDSCGNRLRFRVTDTGIGMTPQQRSRLFQPFSQGGSTVTQEFGGTGLGLAISQRLASKLGGEISVESVLDQGSTFTVTIGVGDISESPLLAPTDVVETQTPAANFGDKRLDGSFLIVDDRRDIRFLSKLIISKAGGSLTEAEDGVQAVRIVERAIASGTAFDLILLDMQMPKMDGYETARRLRAIGYVGPIIALTANAMQGDMSRCLEAGCNDYLSKPIDKAALLATIHEHLETR